LFTVRVIQSARVGIRGGATTFAVLVLPMPFRNRQTHELLHIAGWNEDGAIMPGVHAIR
jgi:hypothetical protein